MNNTEYRTSTSVSSEINRLVRDIDKHRAIASDFYEELLGHASFFKSSKEGSNSSDERKRRFKRMGVILEELKEEYWDINDLIIELNGVELFESKLTEEGLQITRELIDFLTQLEPAVRNAHKTLRSNELGTAGTDLLSIVENQKFFTLNGVLKNILTEISALNEQFKDLRQKRIM